MDRDAEGRGRRGGTPEDGRTTSPAFPGSQLEARRQAVLDRTTAIRHGDLVHGRHPAYRNGNNNTRAYCNLLQLALGNMSASRAAPAPTSSAAMTNVQGATDLGVALGTRSQALLRPRRRAPGNTGRVFGTCEYDYLASASFDEVPDLGGRKTRSRMDNMVVSGLPSTRCARRDLAVAGYRRPAGQCQAPWSSWGHGAEFTRPRLPGAKSKTAIGNAGHAGGRSTRYPTNFVSPCSMIVSDGTAIVLPACTQFEMLRLARPPPTARSSGGEKVVDPVFESRQRTTGHHLQAFAQKLGFADEMFKNIAVDENGASPRSRSRRRSRCCARSTSGMLDHRLYRPIAGAGMKKHMENQHTFDIDHPSGAEWNGPMSTVNITGMPWPCWGTAGDGPSRHAQSSTTPIEAG